MNMNKSNSTDNKRLEREIEHGKKIAEHAGEVWNWESPAGKRRWARRAKMLTSHISPKQKVLELGCGTGYFTKELSKTQTEIVAIDISPDLLERAKTYVNSTNVLFKIDNAYEMSFEDEVFDVVVGSSVLHHLDISRALKEIYRVLKPGGIICFTEPNMLNPQIAIERNIHFIGKRLGNSPDETAFFKWQMLGLLKRTDFKEITVIPFDFLHPAVPGALVPFFEKFCNFLEKIPLVKEIAGSLYIVARK